jgi:hypothetical protein
MSDDDWDELEEMFEKEDMASVITFAILIVIPILAAILWVFEGGC